jgi:hypothetical protein
MEYTEPKGQIGALSARNLAKFLVRFFAEISNRPLAEALSPSRFWIPGRGQNGTRQTDERRKSRTVGRPVRLRFGYSYRWKPHLDVLAVEASEGRYHPVGAIVVSHPYQEIITLIGEFPG